MADFVWASTISSLFSVGSNWQVGGVPQASPPTTGDRALFGQGTGATNTNCQIDAAPASLVDFLVDDAYTGTLTHNAAINVPLTGSLRLGTGMTYTLGNTGTSLFTFTATTDNGGVGFPITTSGKTMGSLTFNGSGGKWQLQDSLTCSSAGTTITLTAGHIDTNSKAVSSAQFSSSNSNARALTLGTTVWSITATSGQWNVGTTTNMTLSAASSTIQFTSTNTSAKTFTSGTLTWGTVRFTAAAVTQTAAITAAAGSTPIIGTLTVSGTGKTVQFIASRSVQVNAWDVSGTAGNLITVNTSVAGTQATIILPNGIVVANYLTVKDIAVTTGPLVCGNSTDSGNNNVQVVFSRERSAGGGPGWSPPYGGPSSIGSCD